MKVLNPDNIIGHIPNLGELYEELIINRKCQLYYYNSSVTGLAHET